MVLPNDEQQSKDKERTLELKEKEIQERPEILNQQKVFRSSIQCSIETADNATQVQEGIILMSYFNHVLCINLFF